MTKNQWKEWKWQRGNTPYPICEGPWRKSQLSACKRQPEERRSWNLLVEGFQDHVATDGSSWGESGRWGASGCSVAQLDHDEELGQMHGMYGALDANLEVQRTIKRADLTDFHFVVKRTIGQDTAHVDNQGINDRLHRGEMRCFRPTSKDVDLWIHIWEESQENTQSSISFKAQVCQSPSHEEGKA